ncbi:hypothetical protein CEXT_282031 [Caerostris extrusa]|uniref:Uncharacterized protein n=1 Tax=Caerostris extrusa TaxID=172846 RepID=A0AAV4MVB7_CAEEX|nr:hypothetical protein CEXT_282031 [Caerostris extrusa]
MVNLLNSKDLTNLMTALLRQNSFLSVAYYFRFATPLFIPACDYVRPSFFLLFVFLRFSFPASPNRRLFLSLIAIEGLAVTLALHSLIFRMGFR